MCIISQRLNVIQYTVTISNLFLSEVPEKARFVFYRKKNRIRGLYLVGFLSS